MLEGVARLFEELRHNRVNACCKGLKLLESKLLLIRLNQMEWCFKLGVLVSSWLG